MITVEYRGGLGNQMFQYSYGRLLADKLDYQYEAPKIEMFPALMTHISGTVIEHGVITFEQNSKHPVILHDTEIESRACGFAIHLKGYFEFSQHYIEHQKRIKTWFPMSDSPSVTSVVAVHVRGGDSELWRNPPVDYYADAIRMFPKEQPITIYTDDPQCEDVSLLRIMFPRTLVISSSEWEDFKSISRHDKIIIGNSTFAWWAAFLSSATTVIQPEPMQGWRSLEFPNSYLRVPEWKSIQYGLT